MRTALLALILSACANVHVNRGALIASTAVLACDWGQTRSGAASGWATARERNPVMGPTPTTGTVDLYFLVVAAINTGIWVFMPRRYRSILPMGLLAVEIRQVSRNVDLNVRNPALPNMGTCGI